MIRLNRWWYGLVVVVVLFALFIDTYSYTYRFFVAHKGLHDTLYTPPTLLGRQLYLHKGLDLQGGTELTIAICQGPDNPQGSGCRSGVPAGKTLANAQAATVTIMSQRVNGLGVAEANVQAQGSDQVLVQLPGVDIQTATKVLGTTARLYFGEAVANANAASLPTVAELNRDQLGHWLPREVVNTALYPTGYHWRFNTSLDATNVTSATVNPSTANGNGVGVDITFDDHGASVWGDITGRAVAQPSGTPQNRVAIFLDNSVLTAPQVNGRSTNQTEITGSFTIDSAKQLADQVSAGSLPAEIATIQSTEVSASLGSDTVRHSVIAGAVGLFVVILFMLGYYRFPGLLAGTALLAYTAIVLALYKLVPVTVTLAGLAGFLLSVGMAVDANVLIFERTRDELRHGKAVAAAVEAGFRRAWPAIRDSNVSTMIACAVLYTLGSSVVKGFALTLFLGVAVSMFSAILITQALLQWVLNFRRSRNPHLYTELREDLETNPPKGRFDIVSNRNVFFASSLALIIPGLIAILAFGFRLGIDFAGGNRLDIGLRQPVAQAQVIDTVNTVKAAQAYKPEVRAASNNEFIISTLPSPTAVVQDITTALETKYGIATDASGHPKISQTTVGPTIAHTLVRNAVILVLVSSVLIAFYLAVRFGGSGQISRWRFSVCTFFKLLHDVFVLLGLWAILGKFSELGQVDSLFVTAVLTSVAFSIHDTIVVFDRVRENLRTGARMSFDQVINLSTVQTMTRSLNTALTVVFVLLALVLMGGSTIRGFTLALLIGIVTGTYSSIFNASTLLVAWTSIDEAQAPAGPQRRGSGPRRVERRGAAV